jgi:hypothetical protein
MSRHLCMVAFLFCLSLLYLGSFLELIGIGFRESLLRLDIGHF